MSHHNLVKDAAIAAIEKKALVESEQEAREKERMDRGSSRQKAEEAEGSLRAIPYSEHLARQHPPPPPRTFTENSSDDVVGRGSKFTEML